MDTSQMKQVTVAWLAENVDEGWRWNGLLTNLPRAYIKIGDGFLQVAEIYSPMPSWAVGSDGLFSVWLTEDYDEPLKLQGEHSAWLDESDVQPLTDRDDETSAPIPPMLDTKPLTVTPNREYVSDSYPPASTARLADEMSETARQIRESVDETPAPTRSPERYLGEQPITPTVCILHVYRENEDFIHDVYGVFSSRPIAKAHAQTLVNMSADAPALLWELGDDGHEFVHTKDLRLAVTNWVVSSNQPVGNFPTIEEGE